MFSYKYVTRSPNSFPKLIFNGVATGVMDLRVELGRSSEWKETFHKRVVDSLVLPPFNFNLTTRDKVGLHVV